MEWVKSKTTMIFGICLAVMGLQGYATMSMRKTMEERLTSLEDEYAAADERITMLSSDLGVVTKRTGVTAQELQQAQGMAIQLKRDNARLSHRLRTGLAAKADSKAVATFQNEATTRLNAVQQEAKTNFDGISGDVRLVRTDLDATRSDLKATRVDLNATREDVANSKRELGTLIARNS